MKSAKISDVKAHFSEHIRSVERGDSVIVLDRDKPVARIVPYKAQAGLEITEPHLPGSTLTRLRGVTLRKRVDVVALLRDDRDER